MYVNGIREAKHKTKVRQNTQDPVWNHPCVFEINRENPKLLGHVFVFHIIHKDMMMGVQKIGQVRYVVDKVITLLLGLLNLFRVSINSICIGNCHVQSTFFNSYFSVILISFNDKIDKHLV